jgi:hypothetical protein
VKFKGQVGELRDPGFNQFQFKAPVPIADDGQQTNKKDLTKKGGKTQIQAAPAARLIKTKTNRETDTDKNGRFRKPFPDLSNSEIFPISRSIGKISGTVANFPRTESEFSRFEPQP